MTGRGTERFGEGRGEEGVGGLEKQSSPEVCGGEGKVRVSRFEDQATHNKEARFLIREGVLETYPLHCPAILRRGRWMLSTASFPASSSLDSSLDLIMNLARTELLEGLRCSCSRRSLLLRQSLNISSPKALIQ